MISQGIPVFAGIWSLPASAHNHGFAFQIPQDVMLQLCNSYLAADTQPLSFSELMGEGRDSRIDLEVSIQSLLKESFDRFKGWLGMPGPLNTEISCKKVGDVHPLRLWKVSTEVEAPPQAVLQRVLRERRLWDEDLLQEKVMEALDHNTEVYHYVTDSMAPHPRRDFLVLRKWRSDLPRGGCLLVSLSLDHKTLPLEGGVRAVVLTSQYLMEPCGMGRSRVTHICRADLRGRSPDWYSKVFGRLCRHGAGQIRDSFPALDPSAVQRQRSEGGFWRSWTLLECGVASAFARGEELFQVPEHLRTEQPLPLLSRNISSSRLSCPEEQKGLRS
uniref:stAR-related lipid transfer protein 8-like n=1 Tax=Podarcis muralis TaxID=64176 RepID=UPI0010A0143F|nr:stAR-related lipid transfer protein 8-like [Podarcis muralis]